MGGRINGMNRIFNSFKTLLEFYFNPKAHINTFIYVFVIIWVIFCLYIKHPEVLLTPFIIFVMIYCPLNDKNYIVYNTLEKWVKNGLVYLHRWRVKG